MNHQPSTIIVTGSTSGIGRAVAAALLARGDNVILNGRDPKRVAAIAAELDQPQRTAYAAGSIGQQVTGEALVAVALERFGRVDGLVNNAGTFTPRPFVDVSEAELDGFLGVNLRGTYLTSQAAVRQMKRQGDGGAIVNIGTVLIDHALGGFPASAPLVSKGGVHALTVSLAAELAGDRIRVNAVAPGIVRTPLHDPEMVDALGALALQNRIGETGEIAAAVLFLLDAGFITGHILPVDGGFISGRP